MLGHLSSNMVYTREMLRSKSGVFVAMKSVLSDTVNEMYGEGPIEVPFSSHALRAYIDNRASPIDGVLIGSFFQEDAAVRSYAKRARMIPPAELAYFPAHLLMLCVAPELLYDAEFLHTLPSGTRRALCGDLSSDRMRVRYPDSCADELHEKCCFCVPGSSIDDENVRKSCIQFCMNEVGIAWNYISACFVYIKMGASLSAREVARMTARVEYAKRYSSDYREIVAEAAKIHPPPFDERSIWGWFEYCESVASACVTEWPVVWPWLKL